MRELIPQARHISKVILLKLYLDHSQFRKSQEGLETANCLTRSIRSGQLKLLSRPPRHNPPNARVTLSTGDQANVSKNNLTRNYLRYKAHMGSQLAHPSSSLGSDKWELNLCEFFCPFHEYCSPDYTNNPVTKL